MEKVSFQSMVSLIEDAFSRGQTITIPVTGTSMMPLLRPGDAVTLTAVDFQQVEKGDILLYRRRDGRFVLHRVVEIYTDSVDFCGDNQVEVETGVSKAQVIAQVISYEKDHVVTDLKELRAEGRRRLQNRPIRAAATKWHRLRTARSTPDGSKSRAVKYLFGYLKQRVGVITLMCLLSSVGALSTLGMALVSGHVIDKAMNPADMHHFAQWFWILFALLAVVVVCNVLYSNLRVSATAKLRNDIRRDLFEKLLRKQYMTLQGIHTGEVLNCLTSDVQIVVDNIIALIPQLLSLVIKLVGGVLIMLYIEPIFTGFLILGAVAIGVLIQFFSRYYKAAHKQCQETEGRTRSFIQECMENIVVIKSFVNDKGILGKLDSYQSDNYKKQLHRNTFANIGNTGLYAGFTFAYYAGLAWGVLRIAGQIGSVTMPFGYFVTFLQIMEQIRAPFRSASGVLPQVISMFASAERLYELSMLPEEPDLQSTEACPQASFACLEFDHITFSYDDGRTVLKDASASLKKGQFAVLVGSSGVGKTTIIKLLLGLIEPQSGTITLSGDAASRQVDASTRPMFSYVPQGNLLLSGTLRENILFGTDHVTPQELERVLELACLQDLVASLPNGINTFIGERGVGLSEGQLQRIAVARALLSKAPILLLDECTSALDEETEKSLLNNLHSLDDRTILFISHRTAVLDCADVVWTLDNGSIIINSD